MDVQISSQRERNCEERACLVGAPKLGRGLKVRHETRASISSGLFRHKPILTLGDGSVVAALRTLADRSSD